MLDPATIDEMVLRFGIPLSPCMKQLHAMFRDKRFVRSTNYENLMRFLEARREERQRLGPDEIQDLRLQKTEHSNPRTYIQYSHWSNSYITALSLVKSFIVLLRQLSYAIKNQLVASKAPY